MITDAKFSIDRAYRYNLLRVWDEGKEKVCFIGLNPSTANATTDDPTIRRCIGFARTWGFGGLWMGNLFAFVSTDPSKLTFGAGYDPIGKENDTELMRMVGQSSLVIAAWGTWKQQEIRDRSWYVRTMFTRMKCLGKTKDGQPRHPLYLKADTTPTTFCEVQP